MENKNGFISTALVYSFLVIYLFLMVSIINLYLQKNTYIEALDEQVAEDIGITKNTKTGLMTAILRDNVALETSRIDWNGISGSSSNNGRGLFYIDENGLEETEEPKYTDEDNNGFGSKIYFFRGNVNNNNVVFGYQFKRNNNEIDDETMDGIDNVKQMCWLILRTTESGSIKLLYNGTYNGTKCDGTNNTINSYVVSNECKTASDYCGQYNRNNNDNAYVGYTYGTAGSTSFDVTHYDTQNNSDIKSAIENFYFRNTSLYNYSEFGYGYDVNRDTGTSSDDILLVSRYEQVEDVIYCNDRQYECVEVSTKSDEKPCGYSTKSTNYGYKTQKDMVTYICPELYDRYMLDNVYANGSDDVTNLNFAVALPTASEIIMAGGSLSENNEGYFLRNQSTGYWTMSPSGFDGVAKVYSVDTFGKIVPTDVNTSLGIRPVISIEADIGVSYGSGLPDEPYMLN